MTKNLCWFIKIYFEQDGFCSFLENSGSGKNLRNNHLPTYPVHRYLFYFFPGFSHFLQITLYCPSSGLSRSSLASFSFCWCPFKCCFCDGLVSFSKNTTQPSKLSLLYYSDQVFLSCSYVQVLICYFPGPVNFTYFPQAFDVKT